MEFKKVKLEKAILLANTGADAIKRAPIVNYETEYRCLRIGDVSNNRPFKDWGYTSADKNIQQKFSLVKNDILLARTGNTIGVATIIKENLNAVFNNGLIRLKINDHFNASFIYYLITSALFKGFINQISGGTSTQPNVKIQHVLQFLIPDIPLEIQNKISSILETLDEKIKLNNKVISNLEQLSQTLFKQWFIDFEFPNEEGKPYKSSGGEMVESELGEIPKGWCVSEIDNLGTIIGGGTPSKKYDEYYTNNGISWITPKDLSNDKNTFIYKGAIDITELGLKKSSARILQKDTVLFSSRAPIGYIAIAGKEVTTNQGFKSIVPDKGYSSYFIYHLLKFKLPMIEAAAGGSTFKEISGKGLKEIPVTLPTVELVNIYKEIVEPLFLQIQTLEKENQNLQQLRDTLLPKLLSGEIEIPDDLEV